jgi:hypothetical protein
MIGPGGEFVFTGGGSDWLVYHYYDAFDNGDAWIQVRPLTWVGGWPVTGQALVPVPGQPGPPGSLPFRPSPAPYRAFRARL